jgi:transcriptional regulator with XRE-family HTH domain
MHPLREARRARGLSMKELADRIGICERTVWAAEQGKPLRIDSIRLICAYFEQPATALGLVCQQHNELSDPALREEDIKRRDALHLLTTGSSLAFLTPGMPFTSAEALGVSRTLLGVLWRASLAEHVETVQGLATLLLRFVESHPSLRGEQRAAASLMAEAHLILATAARHLLQPGKRLEHLQQAERYAQMAADALLTKTVLDYMGYGYNWDLAPGTGEYAPQPEAALLCFQRGLALKRGPASPALESDLLGGLAEAYSLLHEARQALKALALAEERYAASSPATDPGYELADAPAYTIPLRRVRILVNLGQTKGVLTALEESQRLYEAQWPQAKGRGLAELQPRRAAVALALNEQELFMEALEASMEAARQSGSRYALAMVKQVLTQGQARWPQLRDLAHWKEQLGWLAS